MINTESKGKFQIVTLSLKDYGLVPCSDRITVCHLPEGFSVLLTSDQLDNEMEVGSTNETYSWRKFASILSRITDGSITADSYTLIKVDGEDGIRADILVLSWGCEGVVDWLIDQSDSSLNYLQEQLGSLLDEKNLEVVKETSELFIEVYGRNDLLSVFTKSTSLNFIIESLQDQHISGLLSELERKKNIIKPYLSKILNVIECHGDDYQAKANVFKHPSKTDILRLWMENYIESNDRFPEGEHSVVISGKWLKTYDLGVIDFGKA
jgi:hypothetical protein